MGSCRGCVEIGRVGGGGDGCGGGDVISVEEGGGRGEEEEEEDRGISKFCVTATSATSYTMYLYMYLMHGWSIQSLTPLLDSFEATRNVLFSGKRRIPLGQSSILLGSEQVDKEHWMQRVLFDVTVRTSHPRVDLQEEGDSRGSRGSERRLNFLL